MQPSMEQTQNASAKKDMRAGTTTRAIKAMQSRFFMRVTLRLGLGLRQATSLVVAALLAGLVIQRVLMGLSSAALVPWCADTVY
jgi:hypothetical protein